MRQRFGVSANAAPNTCWTQFINHANYKIIDLNVIDWANATKIHTPPSAKRYFPPWRACAVQRQFRDREWRAIESHCWHRTGAWWKCVVHVSWTRNINAWGVKYLFAINAQFSKKTRMFSELYVMRVFSFYFSQLIAKVRPHEHCIPASRWQLLAVISSASGE